jgi:drug/metabolite transporter (DMT)-like permease
VLVALGLLAALAASALFNIGLVLQALEARREPKSRSLRLSLVASLLRRPRWLLGTALGLIGVGPQVVALALAPFVVVQPALSAGLLLLLAVGRRTLGEPVGLWEWAGVVAIIGGIALVAAGAPGHAETHRRGLAVILVAGIPAIASLLPFAVRGTRLDTTALVVGACGVGFAAANIATKLFGDDAGLGHYANAAAWAAVGLGAGIAATVTGMTAFQRARATMVVPVTTAVQTYLPIVLEPLFLRERWGSAALDGLPLAAGVVLAAIGTVLVARARSVSSIAAAAQR